MSGEPTTSDPEGPAVVVADPSRRWLLALLVAVFLVYAPTLANGFAGDDVFRVQAVRPDGSVNRITAELRPLGEYFGRTWEGESEWYRPLTVLSYAVVNQLTGGAAADPDRQAFPHHLLNVLLHVWSVLLGWQLLRRLFPRGFAAVLGAAVFGLNAIHSEVVAGVVGRAELLAFCLGAQGVLLFARTWWRNAGCASLLFLACCGKESGIAWCPFLVVFAVAAPGASGRRVRDGLFAAGCAVLPLAMFLWARHLAGAGEAAPVHYMVNPLAHEDAGTRVLTGVMLWGYGLLKCLWPFVLCAEYGVVTFDLVRSPSDPRFLLAAVVLVGWLVAGLLLVRRHPALFLAMACFLGFGFITSNVPFAVGTIFAERLYFTPSLAVAMLVGWLVSRGPPRWLLVPLGGWLLVSVVAILSNNGAWADDASLQTRDFATNPRSVRRLDQIARRFAAAGRWDEAAGLWQRAIGLDPQYSPAISEYALRLAERGGHREAEKLLLQSLTIPDHREPQRHITRLNLSVLYERMGDRARSLEQLRAAWREDTAFAEEHGSLIGRTQALFPPEEFERIVAEGERRVPDNPQWALVRGKAAYDREDYPAAERHFRRVLDRLPRDPAARFALASAVLAQGRKREGRRMLEALRGDSTVPDYIRLQVEKRLR